MEAHSERESRLSRGWRLTVAVWQLMRQDPAMIGLALLGTGCGIAGAVLVVRRPGRSSPSPSSRWR